MFPWWCPITLIFQISFILVLMYALNVALTATRLWTGFNVGKTLLMGTGMGTGWVGCGSCYSREGIEL